MVLGFEVSNRHPTSCWGMLLHSYTTCGMYNQKYRHINMNIDIDIDNLDLGVGVNVDGDVAMDVNKNINPCTAQSKYGRLLRGHTDTDMQHVHNRV